MDPCFPRQSVEITDGAAPHDQLVVGHVHRLYPFLARLLGVRALGGGLVGGLAQGLTLAAKQVFVVSAQDVFCLFHLGAVALFVVLPEDFTVTQLEIKSFR